MTVWPVVQKVIARASNRVIVGLPRCEYYVVISCMLMTARAGAGKAPLEGGMGLLTAGMFVGRDKKYLDVAINFTNDVFISSFVINLFPDFLKPYANPFLRLERRPNL